MTGAQIAVVDGRGNVYCMNHFMHGKGELIPQDRNNSAMDGLTCDACGSAIPFSLRSEFAIQRDIAKKAQYPTLYRELNPLTGRNESPTLVEAR